MWLRRQTTKFNGVPYIIQRGAEAVFSEQGQKECREMLAFYKENARIMAEGLRRKGIKFYGGTHSPYIWLQCPQGMSSWEFFDFLLEKLAVVGLPAPVLALWAKDTSVCPLLAAVKTLSKQWNALKKNCKQNNKNAWF